MRSVMGSQVNRLWLPAAASIGMATHAVSMETDSTHTRPMLDRPEETCRQERGGDTEDEEEEEELAAFGPGRLFSSAQWGRERAPPRPSLWEGGGFWSAAPVPHTSSITPETPASFKRRRRDHSAGTPPSQPLQEEDEDEDEDEDDAGLGREKICLNALSASFQEGYVESMM